MPGRVRQPHQRLPPVPGRLARHRQPGEPGPGSLTRRPFQQAAQLVRLRLNDLAGQHPPLMINQHRSLLILTQVRRQHRPVPPHHPPHRGDPPVPVPVPPRQPATLSHERPPAVLGSEARHHIRRTFLQQPEQSQQVVTTPAYAAVHCHTPRKVKSRPPGKPAAGARPSRLTPTLVSSASKAISAKPRARLPSPSPGHRGPAALIPPPQVAIHSARGRDAGVAYWSPVRTDVMRWVLKPSQCIRPA